MSCTKAQVLLLLEKIKEELVCEADRRVLEEYIERVRRCAWLELLAEL